MESPIIQRLPDDLINQIAAGEVVERPASAIKELVENSLDAGSTRLDIHLKQGGIEEILIIDNGWGMNPENLRLCTERHTTSKIRKLSDLEQIGTFGFRGEALSSICSVADVEIRSRSSEQTHANLLSIHHGETEPELKPAAAPVGTSIRVRELFSRIPARQKFLRSPPTELAHCTRVVRELALGNAHVFFAVHHEDRSLHTWAEGTRLSRFRQVFRATWEPLHFQESHEGIEVETFLSPPSLIQDRGELLFYVNGRVVRNKGLSSCLRTTYSSTLGPHHEPSGVVYLDIRRDWVDVNVHPQKLEVRLLRQEALYSWLHATLRKRLAQVPAIPLPIVSEKVDWNPPVLPGFYQPAPTASSNRHFTPPPPVPTPPGETLAASSFRILGRADRDYVIVEEPEGLVLIDAPHFEEALRYENLKASQTVASVPVHRPFLPRMIRLAEAERQRLSEACLQAFHASGFEMEMFGEFDLSVKAYPEMLAELNVEPAIRDILAPAPSDVPWNDRICRAVACAPGESSAETEGLALLRHLTKISLELTCPHGRLVLFRLSFRNIEKQFEKRNHT
jgi:DNA mismatch repair protein MutL